MFKFVWTLVRLQAKHALFKDNLIGVLVSQLLNVLFLYMQNVRNLTQAEAQFQES